mgnify:CR=1 FL=1
MLWCGYCQRSFPASVFSLKRREIIDQRGRGIITATHLRAQGKGGCGRDTQQPDGVMMAPKERALSR